MAPLPTPTLTGVRQQIMPGIHDIVATNRYGTEPIPGERWDVQISYADDTIELGYKCGDFFDKVTIAYRTELDNNTYLKRIGKRASAFVNKCRRHFFVARLEQQEIVGRTLPDKLRLRSGSYLCKGPYLRRGSKMEPPRGYLPVLTKFQPIRARLHERHLDH